MEKRVIPLLLALVLIFTAACKGKTGSAASGETLDKDTSYAFGMLIAREFHLPGINLDYDAFVEGYKAFAGGDTRFTMEEAIGMIQPVYMMALENQTLEFQSGETEFLTENSLRPEVVVTSSGLQYEVVSQGDGEKPVVTDTVQVHYRGTLVDGTVFDSSYDRGEPTEFPLGGVIPGWTEGLQLMSVGSIYRLYVPSDLAYGDRGTGNIPPYSPLIFDVELLAIVNK